MSSDSSVNDFPKSTKNLWTLLSGTLNLKSQQFIATELEENSAQLISGVLYFKEYEASKEPIDELVRKRQIDSIPMELLRKMCVLLDVTAVQCDQLFRSYLMYEFKGTPESVRNLLTNEKNVKHLLHQLWHYYYGERLFGLFCVKQILSHWKESSSHAYRLIFHAFLEAIDGENMISKLLQQLRHLNACKMPSRLANGPYFDDSLAKSWVLYNLKEQIEVLQIMLIYYKEFEPSITNIIEILNLFKSNSFGSKFTHFTASDSEHIDEQLFKFIGFLESLLIVECIDLNWLYKCQLQEIEHHLTKTENCDSFKALDSIIRKLNYASVEHSPILLSWMIVRSWQLYDFDVSLSSQVVSQLGANALQLNVFTYLDKSLHLPSMLALRGTVVSDLIYGAIGALLSVTFNIYNIEMLENSITSLTQLCATLFSNDCISKDLFTNGLDSGLGIIIRSVLNNFPYNSATILNFCNSLAETNNCKQIFEKLSILSNLTTFAEPFDTSLAHTVPTHEESIFMLLKDIILYRNYELIIKKDTKGVLRSLIGHRIIQWKDINIDGWKVLYHRSKETFDLISRGQIFSVPESAINELSQIARLLSHLIDHKCFAHISSFNKLISLCFETFELFSTIERPPRLLMASMLQLFAVTIKQDLKKANWIWLRITEKKFLPFMIGLTNNWKQLMNGNDTNTSILGEIIASEECIRGYYQLCISFLNLIVEVSKRDDLRKDECFLASIIYVMHEIFPSHYFWTYADKNDCFKIGRLCYDIYYNILTKTDKSVRCRVEEVCICALVEGTSAEALLKTIKSGESIVRDVIVNSGNDTALSNDNQVISVRRSLSILNLLLALNVNPKSPSTVVETALFSAQSKPNILLILAHYVYQRYDTHLAILGVDLLKQLARKFPMSMLACLGSEAESIRDHFLYRLEEVTEDLDLKIALLNFLSQCVKYQPGLMEMFLNVDNDNDSYSTTGCLQTVLEILAEKREGKYFCPFELHFAALRFVYTFWLQPHLLAIDSLKKTTNVWTLITFPLFEETTPNDKLNAYVLRILSREIFYVKTLERDKFDCDLENKFKSLSEDNHLSRLSSHLISRFTCESEISDDSILLLESWKDFLVSISKFEPFTVPNETKTIIAIDLITMMSYQLKNTQNNLAMVTLSETILIVLSRWKETCISAVDDWNLHIGDLLINLNSSKESLPLSVINAIETLIIQFLQLFSSCNSLEWMTPICGLINYSLRIIEKQVIQNEKLLNLEFKLAITTVSLLTLLVKQNRLKSSLWLPKLRSFLVLESLSNLLLYLIDRRIGAELCSYIMCLLVTLSSISDSSETLLIMGIVDNLCISLQNTYNNSDSSNKDNSTWIPIFHMSMRMVIEMLITLKHHFIETTITFVAVHLDHLREVLVNMRTCPRLVDIEESIIIVSLCHLLSNYNEIWQKNHQISFNTFQSEILKTCNAVIAFLIRPNLLTYIMENPRMSASAILSIDATPKNVSHFQTNIEEKNIPKSVSWESDFLKHRIDSDVQNSLLKLHAISITYLLKITPNILELMEKQGIDDCKYNLILNTSFGSPNINPENTLSFGSLLNGILVCVKTINRSERSSSPTINEIDQIKTTAVRSDLLIYIFETSLTLLVSQNLIAQLSHSISSVEKQLIAREIKSELSSILSNIGSRQTKRSSQSSLIISTPKSSTLSIVEKSFVKFLLKLVDKLSQ